MGGGGGRGGGGSPKQTPYEALIKALFRAYLGSLPLSSAPRNTSSGQKSYFYLPIWRRSRWGSDASFEELWDLGQGGRFNPCLDTLKALIFGTDASF